jgi:hypothetical protein
MIVGAILVAAAAIAVYLALPATSRTRSPQTAPASARSPDDAQTRPA